LFPLWKLLLIKFLAQNFMYVKPKTKIMGETKNYASKEAIDKMKEMADRIRTCMFCTNIDSRPFETRPMGTLKVDDLGNFWFFSASDSHKNEEIETVEHVHLIYADPAASEFMNVCGTATVSRDRQKIDELWSDYAKAWFKEGKDDPRLTVICVKPHKAYYWDTKYGKAVTLLAIAAAAVTGKTMDAGVEGELIV
jgi:general stress protein 26